ncbi:KpsF/GutQ family sugar-phosphate isomerase [Pseudoroseicyclus tamaricis]|uniref:KpsF/GutQ family sugar-phosphate isomerase n=1 Tax=Pseudoroseicyclus tamaricis TaxID=2705421 RepID=A0A6B2JW13_9RHOB|nr:KpsF/GutQ family sugar-phosphate isomerase [Pseudoroseicyclus tamaricis]NDV02095.1 KpsF/GutQ family sugar-phosphate isomerase [Pseudoroseicyclus tamaricis]
MTAQPQPLAPAPAAEIKAEMARVLRCEAAALEMLAGGLEDSAAEAVRLIRAAPGRVIVTGMGKSGHVARKIAATFASTGTPAQFVHPAEASHGDLGMIAAGDVVLAISNSGETAELADLVTYSRRFSIPLIAVTKVPGSSLGRQADVILRLPDAPEACPMGRAPTSSTTASMALGDALAVVLMTERGFKEESFHAYHPGGRLGAQLLTVRALMHSGAELPVLAPQTPMGEGIIEITAKGFGTAAVIEDGRLIGIITDGDLRRHLAGLMEKRADEIATLSPTTIAPDALASEALALMNARKISALFAVSESGEVEGLIHIHDCLRAGVA